MKAPNTDNNQKGTDKEYNTLPTPTGISNLSGISFFYIKPSLSYEETARIMEIRQLAHRRYYNIDKK